MPQSSSTQASGIVCPGSSDQVIKLNIYCQNRVFCAHILMIFFLSHRSEPVARPWDLRCELWRIQSLGSAEEGQWTELGVCLRRGQLQCHTTTQLQDPEQDTEGNSKSCMNNQQIMTVACFRPHVSSDHKRNTTRMTATTMTTTTITTTKCDLHLVL